MKTTLALLIAFVLALAAQAKVSENIHQTHPINPDASIELSNVNGRIDVVTWDKNEVDIQAEKIAPDEEDLKKIDIEIEASATDLRIKTNYNKKGWFGNTRGEVIYQLKVPVGVTLKKVETVNSDVSVTGVRGKVSAGTVNGTVRADVESSKVFLHTVNGSIEAKVAKMGEGSKVELKTVNGSCELEVPSDSSARVDAHSVNGHVSCDLPIVVKSSGRSKLHGTIGSGAGYIELESVNGSLSISKR